MTRRTGKEALYPRVDPGAKNKVTRSRTARKRETVAELQAETVAKPSVRLQDGNAYAILGACQVAARRAHWTMEQWEKFKDEAKSGDYDQLLQTCMKYFEVEQ